jgi:hypothetical protein
MMQSGLVKCLIVSAALVLGTLAAKAARQNVEIVPPPSGTIIEGTPHVAHGDCCTQTCGHCAPEAHHKYRLTARRTLKCQGSVEVCMHVVNPACCGCPVEIPMCIPACCTEPPTVSSDCGLFGRGIVCFDWPCCGYSARVVFKHSGHIDVVYTAR